MSKRISPYRRPHAERLARRLAEPRRFIDVVAIRKECRPLTSAQKALLKECLRQVRKAWPGFGFLSWLSFR
jgi:hypothetical protein